MAIAVSGWSSHLSLAKETEPYIKVGILHSLSGTLATNGQSVIDGILMAIDEINEQGGLLEKRLKPIISDGASNPATFEQNAATLIGQDRVHTIFGCWSSANRKSVKPVVEREDHLLWYPVQYEGQEQSPSIMYGGAAPNQQILPAVQWGIQQFGKRILLVGSDYLFPRAANRLIKSFLPHYRGHATGELYQPLGKQDFRHILHTIKQTKPDFILNTINGDSNQGFFQSLVDANLTAHDIPVISTSIGEDELQQIGIELTLGHYSVWNYFQSIDSPSNRRFVANFKRRYGQDRVTGDPIESAYSQVHLYAMAVRKAGTHSISEIRQAAKGLIFGAPQGLIRIDPENQHTWKVTRIGRVQDNGQFTEVWKSHEPLHPNPYPMPPR
ncbi:MAG: urea ABC transporter substrate-binding protein [Nitrospirales bacterium]|nr:MAG: urea ABC transporter substrate-binding protein [Nitrospirales bacterium]